jgi:hypothetical protein
MLDRLLSLAGGVAFAAHRSVTATLKRPWAILAFVALLAAIGTGMWWILLLALPGIFMADSRREIRDTRFRIAARQGRKGSTYNPTPVGDFSAAPIVAAVALLIVALLVDLPTPALTITMRLAVAAVAAIILLGWRVGFVVFRPRPLADNQPSTPLDVGASVTARASGRLLSRDVIFRVQIGSVETWHAVVIRSAKPDAYAPTAVRLRQVRMLRTPLSASTGGSRTMDQTRLIVVTPDGEAGLALARPDVQSVESGVLRLPGGDVPAVRLSTVVGPLELSFENPMAMASAFRVLTEELARQG